MSAGGHMADMQARLKNNALMRNHGKRMADRLGEYQMKRIKRKYLKSKPRQLSEEELLKYRKKILRQQKIELWVTLSVLIAVIALMSTAAIWLL